MEMTGLERYITRQREINTQSSERLELVETIYKNAERLRSMSDDHVRKHNLTELHPQDKITKKFDDAYITVITDSPERNHYYSQALKGLQQLSERYRQRTMTEEEFNFVNKHSAVEILYALFKQDNPGKTPPGLDEMRAEVNYGNSYHYGEAYK